MVDINTSYPSGALNIAAGAKAGAEYTKSREEARIAPELATAKLAQEQAQAKIQGQQATLGEYDVKAASLLDTAAGAQQAINYAEIYNKSTPITQKLSLAKQKLAQAEQMKNKTMASGKFSETTRKAYEDAQQEVKNLELEEQKTKVESYRQLLAPAMLVKDQTTYNYARPQLAKLARTIAEEEARKRGESEEFIKFLGPKVEQETFAKLPEKYDTSAKNMLGAKIAELGSAEAAYKMMEEQRKEEDQDLQRRKTNMEIQKLSAERDKALAEAKEGNPKKVQERIKELRQLVNTESLELNRMTADEEEAAKTRLQNAKDAVEGMFDSWKHTPEEAAELDAAQKSYDDLVKRREISTKIIKKAQEDLELELGIAKEKGIEPPPEEENKKKEDFKKILSQYRPTSGAQGMTVEQVIQELNKQKPGYTPEQYLQVAIKKGFIVKK